MTHPNEQTLFSFDIMFKGILHQRVETYSPLFRIGKQPGLESSIDDPRLDNIHIVFHLLSGAVFFDVPTTKAVCVHVESEPGLPRFLSNDSMRWTPSVTSLILNDDITITNMQMGQVQQILHKKGVHAAIEKDIRETMLSMGVVYSSVADLNLEERRLLMLVTKLCTVIFGQSRVINHLQNLTQQASMTAHRCFNTINVLTEVLFQMSNMDRATYQALTTKVLEALATQAQTGHSPPSPVDAVGEVMLRGPRSRLPSEALQ